MLILVILFVISILIGIYLFIRLRKLKHNAEDCISQRKVDELNEWAEQVKQQCEAQYKQQEDEMYRQLASYKFNAEESIKKEVQDNINQVYAKELSNLNEQKNLTKLAIDKLKVEWYHLNDDTGVLNNQIEDLKHQIELYQNQIDIINEERRLKEAEEAELNTYRLILSDETLEDIKYLDSISGNLIHPRILYKLIWSEYILPAFNDMIKRQFGDKIPKNIIYCIENVADGKKYIGKTAQTAQVRWTSHLKTSLGISDTSPSAIHKALRNHWMDFTFRVLEEVSSNDDINKREKYYIDFFKANIYGYNIKG